MADCSTALPEKCLTLIIQGTLISAGLAQGIIHVHRSLLGPIDAPVDITQNNVNEEFSRLDDATARISDDLLTLATRVEKEIDSRLAEVFGAHQLMLNDSSLWLFGAGRYVFVNPRRQVSLQGYDVSVLAATVVVICRGPGMNGYGR